MLKCKIIGKNLIDGIEQEYNIAEGAVFTECYNETLDSGTIILPHLSAEIEIEPFDVVSITGDNITTKRMCVDTYNCRQISLDPAIYQYEISLFSETKLLEGILLPSLAITKKAQPQNIIDYINQYVNEYGPKKYVAGDYIAKWTIGTMPSKFNATCPELQWNEPTLREVLTDLMMTKDCIPVLKNNVIGYIDISEVGGEITSAQRQGINYIQKSQSSADYISELKMNLKNVIGATNDVYDIISFRNYDAYILTSENVRVETTRPIWKINDANIIANMSYSGSYSTPDEGMIGISETPISFSFNLTDYILEYGEWQTKDIYYQGFNQASLSSNYQNTCLYFIRGQRNIFNFENKSDTYRFLWVKEQRSVLELIYDAMENALIQQVTDMILASHPDAYDIVVRQDTILNYKNMMFTLQYDTLAEQTLLVSKEGKFGIRQVVDNQTQSYIDIERQGMLEYFKANRLGNKMKIINGRYTGNESTIPQLKYKVDGSIIFQKQISVFANHINANYYATDNYVLRDYFTGIKAKLRSYPILTGEQAFLRSDIIKFFVNSNISTYNNDGYLIPVYSTLQGYLDGFNYCLLTFYEDDEGTSLIPASVKFNGIDKVVNRIQVELVKTITGNSVIFTFKMYDNAIAGKYVSSDNYDLDLSGDDVEVMTQKNCPYVRDDNGENYGGVIEFYSGKQRTDPLTEAKLLPYANVNNFTGLVARIPFNYHKDNKEITQITIQFEWNEDANDIFLGKR